MSDLTIEIVGNETATTSTVVTSNTDVEVELASVSISGTVADAESVEVTIGGPVVRDGTTVMNAGNAPALMVLNVGDPIPAGTPVGTVILRK